jgi:uncharacterized membrane protein YqgA involved in biofilm formation
MFGTIVNAGAIIAGALLGTIFRSGIPQRFRETVTAALGLVVCLIGLQSAWETSNVVIVIAALVGGGLVGELIAIEAWLHRVAKQVEERLGGLGGDLANAFVTATLIYCIGAMAIMGSLQSGLQGDHSTLYAKAVIDGISSLFFASSLGPGVLLSAVPVFLYQGAITLLAGQLAHLLTPPMISEMTAAGGILILAIGLNLLELTRIRVGNLLPAVLLAPLIAWLVA